MFCKYCGRQVDEQANFCPHCGGRLNTPAAVPPQTAAPMQPIAPAQKKPVNGFGIAALVIGIICLFAGYYIFFVAIAGIVLGAVGVAYRNKFSANGIATAGLVISCVAFGLWGVIWFFRIFAVSFLMLFFLPFLV